MSRRPIDHDDVLADVLAVTRLGATAISQAELVPPWGLEIDPLAEVAVHVVQRGTCWLRVNGERSPIRMTAGDLVVIRSGVAHAITSHRSTRSRPHREVLAEMPRRLAALPASRAHETTRVLCAKYLFQELAGHPLIELLPPLVHVPARDAHGNVPLQLTLQLIGHEVGEGGRGAALVIPRLVDSLLVFALRAWLAAQPMEAGGWFAALRDPAITRALAQIHRRPDLAWTVEQLAHKAGQSRATFARRFVELVGEPPVAYLTRWRMCVAAKLLGERELALDDVAARVGYETTAAFSKAFRRVHGTPPGRYRGRHRAPIVI